MRNQVKLTFQIGFLDIHPDNSRMFATDVARALSWVCGGCTMRESTGWWMEDGASHADTFSGALQRETCLEFELTCEMHKEQLAYLDAQRAICKAAKQWRIETDWVHVSRVEIQGLHFSVDLTLEEMGV